MKVSITSDGTPHGTRLLDCEKRAIEGVVGIRWAMGLDGPSEAQVELSFLPLERIDAEAAMIGPRGKEVRRIEYADGTVDEFPAD